MKKKPESGEGPDGTIELSADVGDVSLEDEAEVIPSRARPTPPPLPPLPAMASMPPRASIAAPPPKRSFVFYGGVLAACVVVGGIAVAVLLRAFAPKPAPVVVPAATASATAPGVITIPTVEFGSASENDQ